MSARISTESSSEQICSPALSKARTSTRQVPGGDSNVAYHRLVASASCASAGPGASPSIVTGAKGSKNPRWRSIPSQERSYSTSCTPVAWGASVIKNRPPTGNGQDSSQLWGKK